MSDAGYRRLTFAVCACTVISVLAFDLWMGATHGTGNTISWQTWTVAQRYPTLALLAGWTASSLFHRARQHRLTQETHDAT